MKSRHESERDICYKSLVSALISIEGGRGSKRGDRIGVQIRLYTKSRGGTRDGGSERPRSLATLSPASLGPSILIRSEASIHTEGGGRAICLSVGCPSFFSFRLSGATYNNRCTSVATLNRGWNSFNVTFFWDRVWSNRRTYRSGRWWTRWISLAKK